MQKKRIILSHTLNRISKGNLILGCFQGIWLLRNWGKKLIIPSSSSLESLAAVPCVLLGTMLQHRQTGDSPDKCNGNRKGFTLGHVRNGRRKLVQAREDTKEVSVFQYLQGCYNINSDLLFIVYTWEGQESVEVICSKEV